MNQHFLSESYLRQWCDEGGMLLRYRRVGPAARLEAKRKRPRGISFEVDLYTVPPGGTANGMAGNELETKLATDVDERLPTIVARALTLFDGKEDATIGSDLVWLMQVFSARDPGTLRRLEAGVSEFLTSQRPLVEAHLERSRTEAGREQLRPFLDPRMAVVAARAGLASVVARDLPQGTSWLEGNVQCVRADGVRTVLQAIGASEFVTFVQPVVEWEPNPLGLLASFTLSPDLLVLVVERGRQITQGEATGAILRHALLAPRHRTSLICKTEATGELLKWAAQMLPTVD